jgi:rhodanese-related sulfurtransferase
MVPTVTARKVSADAHLLDVREPEEWDAGHAPGSQHIPLSELRARCAEVPADREVVVVCQVGIRSARAAEFLLSNGWEKVYNLRGGLMDWVAAGRPLVTDTDAPGRVAGVPRRAAADPPRVL